MNVWLVFASIGPSCQPQLFPMASGMPSPFPSGHCLVEKKPPPVVEEEEKVDEIALDEIGPESVDTEV